MWGALKYRGCLSFGVWLTPTILNPTGRVWDLEVDVRVPRGQGPPVSRALKVLGQEGHGQVRRADSRREGGRQ